MNTPEEETETTAKKHAAPRKKRHALFDSMGIASMLGLHIVSGIIVGGLIGYALDAWLNTAPWLFIIFLLIGIGAGFRNMWRDAQKIIKNSSTSTDHDLT